jgi:uncharacterized protein YcbX
MHEAHPLGVLAHLWRYPVKSLAPEALERVDVDASGLAGDRRSALFVISPEHAREGKTFRGKEHNLLHTTAESDFARNLAAERGVAIERRDDGPHFDAGTVSVVLDLWVGDLERSLGFRLDPQRFRPNLVVRAAPSFDLREPDLVGAILSAGEVRFRVNAKIARCVTPTYDLVSGESNPEVLRAIASERDNVMGVYCDIVAPGMLERGAEMTFELG